jgi:hypothetical protein
MVTKVRLLKQLFNHLESRWCSIQRRHLLIVGLATLSCMAYIWARDPSEQGFTPPCLFFTFTGLYCPGCGTLRALHQLFNGNVSAAFWLNPLIFLSIPFVAYAFLIMSSKCPRPKLLGRPVHRNGVIFLCLAIVIPYWVLRNTNIEPFAFPSL